VNIYEQKLLRNCEKENIYILYKIIYIYIRKIFDLDMFIFIKIMLACSLELKNISKNLYEKISKHQDIHFDRIKIFFFLLCVIHLSISQLIGVCIYRLKNNVPSLLIIEINIITCLSDRIRKTLAPDKQRSSRFHFRSFQVQGHFSPNLLYFCVILLQKL